MKLSDLSNPIYSDEATALAYFEATRWPQGPVCPFCGIGDKVRPLNGKSMGAGWHYCENCKDKFTARMGTVLERSHVPVHKWLLAMRLMASSKKGISAHQLHRTLGVTYKTAWFLAHRIREAMCPDYEEVLGGEGKVVEADDAFLSPNKAQGEKRPGGHHRTRAVAFVERGGKARAMKIEAGTSYQIQSAIKNHVHPESTLHTDKAQAYRFPPVAKHETVDHSKGEYARDGVTTNSAEGFWGVFRRGIIGTYQHISPQHVDRYLNEFAFRHSNRIALGVDDAVRTDRTIANVSGRRLTYRPTKSGADALIQPKA